MDKNKPNTLIQPQPALKEQNSKGSKTRKLKKRIINPMTHFLSHLCFLYIFMDSARKITGDLAISFLPNYKNSHQYIGHV